MLSWINWVFTGYLRRPQDWSETACNDGPGLGPSRGSDGGHPGRDRDTLSPKKGKLLLLTRQKLCLSCRLNALHKIILSDWIFSQCLGTQLCFWSHQKMIQWVLYNWWNLQAGQVYSKVDRRFLDSWMYLAGGSTPAAVRRRCHWTPNDLDWLMNREIVEELSQVKKESPEWYGNL